MLCSGDHGRVDLTEVEELREDLEVFCAEVFASIPRRDTRGWGNCYLRGLMLEGRRKSIQPMAERLPDGDMQALQQFVGQSPWDPAPVQRRIATKVSQAIAPEAWIVDDTTVPKAGEQSVGAAHQWCGALGKQAVCQDFVSLHAACDAASVPLSWRLFLPESWADPCDERRAKTGYPRRDRAPGEVAPGPGHDRPGPGRGAGPSVGGGRRLRLRHQPHLPRRAHRAGPGLRGRGAHRPVRAPRYSRADRSRARRGPGASGAAALAAPRLDR